jgi:hypothetical protein
VQAVANTTAMAISGSMKFGRLGMVLVLAGAKEKRV